MCYIYIEFIFIYESNMYFVIKFCYYENVMKYIEI